MRRPLSRTLALQGLQGAPGALARRARAMPSLDLRFAETKSLTDAISGQNLITFTRASSGTVVNSAGVLETVASNLPRFDHNPLTGESLGLLLEEQRTNSIRNNTMVGAVAGTPGTLPTNWSISGLGTLTQTVVGTGTANGINYIDIRFNGTTSTTQIVLRFEGTGVIAASNGQAWALSAWVGAVGGSLTNITSPTLANNLFDAGNVYIGEGPFVTATPTSTLTRYIAAGTITNASTASMRPYFYILFASGAAIDITLRIGLPQLEQGAFATSVIPTTGAATTRSADVASIAGSALTSFYNQSEGVMFASGDYAALGANSFSRIVGFTGANTGTDEISLHTRVAVGAGDGTIFGAVTVNSSLEGNLDAPSGVPNLSAGYRSAIAYKANDFGLSSNGLTPTVDTSGTLPTITQLIIMGNVRFQNRLSGHIRRLTYWPQRLPNNSLVAITR